MIEDERGRIDYDETGEGPTVVLVPGSWGTRSAWREVAAALGEGCRIVTTSLLGYGGTAERRPPADVPIDCEAEIVEAVIARAGGPVHLVGHSFGGVVSLAVAARGHAPLRSLTVIEPPVFGLLPRAGDRALYDEVVAMRAGYFDAHASGQKVAARRVIDFYGGRGAFDALPPRMREYVVATTATNVLDWRTGFDTPLLPYADIRAPSLVVRGEHGHRSMARCAEILAGLVPDAALATVAGAGHFMIATHAREAAGLISGAIAAAERRADPQTTTHP
jgi:pimeloyl-ACP methyl ester carboxylesterase